MRIFYSFLTAMALLSAVANAQTITLVQDLNVGMGDAFDEFNYKSAQLGADIVFSASNDTEGYEPYVLKNGSLELLKDIAAGMESSAPTEFTVFNNKVYFTAYDPVNGGALWSTDGTSGGTVLVFDPSTESSTERPKGLTVAKNGALYFSYGAQLYKSLGTAATTSVVPGGETVEFAENWVYSGVNYTPYGDGIAFISKDNKILKLWFAQDSIVNLGELTCDSYYFDYFGINEVQDGLVFAARSSFDPAFNGLYHYSPTLNTLLKIPVAGVAGADIGRVFKLNEDRVIVLEYSKGFVSVNGTGTNDQVISTSFPGLSQGESLNHTIVGGEWAVFHGSEQGFGYDVISTNGTTNGTSTIAQPDKPFSSNFITYTNYAIWASGINNGFVPKIWYANPYHGTSGVLYEHPQGSFSLNSIIILGVQNQKLYFFSNIDADLGRELYYLPLEITPTQEQEKLEGYIISNKGREIIISTPGQTQELDVNVYDAAGRLISSRTLQSNNSFFLEEVNGIYFIEAKAGSVRFANRVFVGN